MYNTTPTLHYMQQNPYNWSKLHVHVHVYSTVKSQYHTNIHSVTDYTNIVHKMLEEQLELWEEGWWGEVKCHLLKGKFEVQVNLVFSEEQEGSNEKPSWLGGWDTVGTAVHVLSGTTI